ncbi:LysR family transcriptional regulator [Tatumella ptyseos ATCC 33301]|uniref:LysR family transcriptional regulator n=2 Tax=Tatumella ptyseos TaxID=82987 RepID=A0A085JH91_9GAMM|nr:LysR family transcriptional regulator [Tatumella ptyseos]KFD19837.1 LysR family transcriptional regulator [Tatumella ptyseos ATCC 33301]
MDLVQLRMFCAVADTGSVARAAELLHRVPSNLTTRLKQLEEELGTDLLIREKQRVRLSPVGHNFLGYAQRILALSEEAISMTRQGEPAGNFALGTMESTAATRLPGLLAAYHQRYPSVSLSLITGTSGEIIDHVREGTVAAALADSPEGYDELHSCVAFREELVLITSSEHLPVTCPRDVQGETFFAFRNSCSYRLKLEEWFREGDAQPGSIMEIHSYHAMIACVAGGAGLAIIPYSVLAQMSDRARIRVHHLPQKYSQVSTCLIWRRDAFTPNVEALKELMIRFFVRDTTAGTDEEITGSTPCTPVSP